MTDDAVLQEWLDTLLERAIGRQCWLFFLDDDDRIVGPVMPNIDYPADPGGSCVTEDLGVRTNAVVFASRFADLMSMADFAQIVIVWERRGNAKITDADRSWPTALGRAFRDEGVRVRAQFLLHSHGIRPLAPDDLPELIEL